ncbi:hypothetical protein [Microbacterium candidum]|uniref:Uncharacterized protein n=1 Tax=Microbacterium candidum TaxID=3041922 RepID=A0ABT7MW89_9MICO|nr:hypothetical protein [Microbacterium sp. ASV49]MDL9978716.1 hypothetical protein [Microbacterium sp. ASV49]
MAEEKNPRIQHMVPDPDRVIEHGQQPTNFVRPPKPPVQVPDGGVGNVTND